jgi:hypothetical protein
VACTDCGIRAVFHLDCWAEWGGHDPECEQVSMVDYVWVSWLLNSKITRAKQKALHRKDIWSTWFAVPRLQQKPCLYTYPRLQNLLQTNTRDITDPQYPSVVSFIGDTGAGKSRLIMALVRNAAPGATGFDVPVPNNVEDYASSTTGHVHMYADPNSANKLPIILRW